ncbi:MAG: cell division protein ZapB [Bryobacteraceae bacterium]
MAASPQVQAVDSWALLEERIRRAVELVEQLRRDNERAERERDIAVGEIGGLRTQIARLTQENERLCGEREKVRGRLEKLLDQLDALGAN